MECIDELNKLSELEYWIVKSYCITTPNKRKDYLKFKDSPEFIEYVDSCKKGS